jgi:hypothetical protein
MLSRISMFLTLISAGLVSIALVGQVSRFGATFSVFAIGVLGFVSLVGFLTQLRVVAVGVEDLMYVLAMNRLRGAYTVLDTGVTPYLLASTHDDRRGANHTYDFFDSQSDLRHVASSSMVLIITVEAALLGLLAGTITHTALGLVLPAVAVGVGVLLIHFLISTWSGRRNYLAIWQRWRPLNPTPASA